MENKEVQIKLKISGMTCSGCEQRIESRLGKVMGIKTVEADYAKESASVTYDSNEVELEAITNILENMGYTASTYKNVSKLKEITFAAFIILGIYMVMKASGVLNIFNNFPIAESKMGYAALFSIGVLTSVHCIAMCGGINLSQCVIESSRLIEDKRKMSSLLPSLKYNLGRVISYTIIGAIAGGLGSAISFSPSSKGIVMLCAGTFMIIMGINMLDIFPWLKRLNPRIPKVIAKKVNIKKQSSTPFCVGLLNGLMPCGPLQAMQIYALSTGSIAEGAFSMFLFSSGTFPLMFGLGAVSSMLSKKFKKRMITASAVLVVVLGVFMFQNGMSLSATGSVNNNVQNAAANELVLENGKQVVRIEVGPSSYEPIVVQKGIPVKWIINVDEENLNGCNNEILVPDYNIDLKLQPGENIVEFTPDQTGKVKYSCWMGMIRSSITVVDDLKPVDSLKALPNAAKSNQGEISAGACCIAQLNN